MKLGVALCVGLGLGLGLGLKLGVALGLTLGLTLGVGLGVLVVVELLSVVSVVSGGSVGAGSVGDGSTGDGSTGVDSTGVGSTGEDCVGAGGSGTLEEELALVEGTGGGATEVVSSRGELAGAGAAITPSSPWLGGRKNRVGTAGATRGAI